MNFSVQLFDLLEQTPEVQEATRTAMMICKQEIQPSEEVIDIAHKTLLKVSERYGMILDQAFLVSNILSPSGTITGTYIQSEIRSGIAKAPVNITLSNVMSPVINLTDAEQIRINHDDFTSISVNALRAFPMKGVVSWSAKTLDGKSNDFRYINVRRTVTMIERTIKDRLRSFVFDPNNIETWVKAKVKVDDFLTDLWRSKVLNGNEAHHAFYVKVGLNETMTAQDILDGIMRVQIGLAISRPAEFIIISFEQLMQP